MAQRRIHPIAPSLAVPQARAWGILGQWKVSLPWHRVGWDELLGPSQPKSFHDSVMRKPPKTAAAVTSQSRTARQTLPLHYCRNEQ